MAVDTVTLTVPARDEYARTVRMTAVAVLGRSGVSVDALDDVRIAVEEAYIYACELGGVDDVITFEFALDDDTLGVKVGPLVNAPDEDDVGDSSDRYARFILESVCDEFEPCEEGQAYFVRFSKHLARG